MTETGVDGVEAIDAEQQHSRDLPRTTLCEQTALRRSLYRIRFGRPVSGS